MKQRRLRILRRDSGAFRVVPVALVAAALATVAAHAVSADEPVAPPKCALRLSVEVTPDVPDPTDGGFVSSLLGNHAGYQLWVVSKVDDTHVELQLQGPGPDQNCQDVVESMRNDGRVASIDVH